MLGAGVATRIGRLWLRLLTVKIYLQTKYLQNLKIVMKIKKNIQSRMLICEFLKNFLSGQMQNCVCTPENFAYIPCFRLELDPLKSGGSANLYRLPYDLVIKVPGEENAVPVLPISLLYRRKREREAGCSGLEAAASRREDDLLARLSGGALCAALRPD